MVLAEPTESRFESLELAPPDFPALGVGLCRLRKVKSTQASLVALDGNAA